MIDKLEELKAKVDKAKLDLARAEERLEKAKEDEAAAVAEMKDAGCTPETIDEEIKKLEKDLEKQTAKAEKEVAALEGAVVDSGGNDAGSGIDAAIQDLGD